MSTAVAAKGLEGIVAANSGICWIDGDAGVLAYRGIDIHELATHSNFEETTYLLWHGKLPTQAELADFTKKLAAARRVDPKIYDLLRSFPKTGTPMEALRTAVSALSFYDPSERAVDHDSNVRKAFDLTAQIAMIVAAFDRIRKGKAIVEPDPSLSHAGNFLYMLNGEKPSETATKAFDIALILHADHELNASTFAARVIAATLSDMHSAITGAIGALKGPLHGGANEQVMRMLLEIGSVDNAEPYVRRLLDQKRIVMGFGHRVYHTEDPRATVLRKMSESLGKRTGKTAWFEMSRKIEQLMIREKNINANVDFYSASAYYVLGIPVDLYTPVFAMSRMSGWTAHVMEQYANNKLIRPLAEYTGPKNLTYTPVDKR